MEIQYFKQYSSCLTRDMEFKVYGEGGKPVLYIPCEGGRFVDFENFHMIDSWAKWIEEGRVTVFAIDTVDHESWLDKNGDPGHRTWVHEQWIHYIVDELVPFIRYQCGINGWQDGKIMTFGTSLGANHALNLFLRFPYIFDCCLALSGKYNSSIYFGDYMDSRLYDNSPEMYLTNMPADHSYIEKYNSNRCVVCSGQGSWEDPASALWLKENFERLGINIWVDLWGYDVIHDWPWWYKMVEYHVPKIL